MRQGRGIFVNTWNKEARADSTCGSAPSLCDWEMIGGAQRSRDRWKGAGDPLSAARATNRESVRWERRKNGKTRSCPRARCRPMHSRERKAQARASCLPVARTCAWPGRGKRAWWCFFRVAAEGWSGENSRCLRLRTVLNKWDRGGHCDLRQ